MLILSLVVSHYNVAELLLTELCFFRPHPAPESWCHFLADDDIVVNMGKGELNFQLLKIRLTARLRERWSMLSLTLYKQAVIFTSLATEESVGDQIFYSGSFVLDYIGIQNTVG